MTTKLKPTRWQGSLVTYKLVYDQIASRWGEEMARRYDPARNCRSYQDWIDSGFKVRRGEKALKSITFIPVEGKNGEVTDVYRKTVNLFYFNQLERVLS